MSNQESYKQALKEAEGALSPMPERLEDFSIDDLEEAKYALTALAAVLEAELRDRYAAQTPMDTA